MIYDLVLAIFAAMSFMPLAFFWGGCPCCGGCDQCTGTSPTQFQVVITGITSGPQCANCEDHNGTWILDSDPDEIAGCDLVYPSPACLWSYTIDPTICTGNGLANTNSILVAIYPGADLYVIFCRDQSGSSTSIRWRNNFVTAPADCSSWVDESIPFDGIFCGNFGVGCDSDGSAALLTAL